MKKRSLVLISSLLVASLSVLPSTSFARPHHKHGHGGGGARIGLYVGVPLAIGAASFYYGSYGPRYYAAPAPVYYYPPVAPIIINPAPVTYIEQAPQVAASQQPNGYWYYCDGAKAYYPYVKECPAGWQPVPATPPR